MHVLRVRRVSLHGVIWVAVACGLMGGIQSKLKAAEGDRTDLRVVVTDAESGQPINQARLTLQFREPGSKMKLKRSQMISFSAKTNLQGHYRFTDIPKGTVRLMVTAERHESYGKNLPVEKDNQVIEVKLKKPQPQL